MTLAQIFSRLWDYMLTLPVGSEERKLINEALSKIELVMIIKKHAE